MTPVARLAGLRGVGNDMTVIVVDLGASGPSFKIECIDDSRRRKGGGVGPPPPSIAQPAVCLPGGSRKTAAGAAMRASDFVVIFIADL